MSGGFLGLLKVCRGRYLVELVLVGLGAGLEWFWAGCTMGLRFRNG